MGLSASGVITISTSAAIRAVRALTTTIQGVGTATTSLGSISSGAFGKLEKGAHAAYGSLRHLNQIISTVKTSLVHIGVIGGGFKLIADDLIKFQAFISTMSVTSGSIAAARQEFDYLLQASNKLGIAVVDVQRDYAQLAAALKDTDVKGEKLHTMFEQLAKGARALHLSKHDTQLYFYAITQMASKGVVSMEELRRQLGEKLPGVLQIAAKSVNTDAQTLEKHIRQAQVDSIKFLPILAEAIGKTFSGAAEIAANALDAQINRLRNVYQAGVARLFDMDVQESFKKVVDQVTRLFNDPAVFNELGNFLKRISEYVANILADITADDVRQFLDAVYDTFINLAQALKILIPIFVEFIKHFRVFLGLFIIFKAAQIGALFGPWGAAIGGLAGIAAVLALEFNAINTEFGKSVQLKEKFEAGGGKIGGLGASGSWDATTPTKEPFSKYQLKDVLRLGGDADKAAQKLAKSIDSVVSSLKFEIEQLHRNDLEQEIYNNLKRAGVTANSKAGHEIAFLTAVLYDEKKAMEAANAELEKQISLQEEWIKNIEQQDQSNYDKVMGMFAESDLGKAQAFADKINLIDKAFFDGFVIKVGDHFETIKLTAEQYDAIMGTVMKTTEKTTDGVIEFWRKAAEEVQDAMSDFYLSIMNGETGNLWDTLGKGIKKGAAEFMAARTNTILFGADIDKGKLGGLAKEISDAIGLGGDSAGKTIEQHMVDAAKDAGGILKKVFDWFVQLLQQVFSTNSLMGGSSSGGSSGGLFGGLFGSLFGGSTYNNWGLDWDTASFNFMNMPFDSVNAFSPWFAKGGIMTPRGAMPLRKYSSGGVANSPQMAIFGEGDRNEAYVPLPDNRRIPVHIKEDSSRPVQQINNITIKTDNPSSVRASRGQLAADFSRELSVNNRRWT